MSSEKNIFTLTRNEFAKSIGKSTDAVKKAMKRGKYQKLYIVKDGQYFFANQKEVGPINEIPQVQISPSKRNRGNHFKAHYPNEALRKTNELKMLLKIKRNVGDDYANKFLNDYDKWSQEQQYKLQKQINKPLGKNYGGPIRNPGHITWKTSWTEIYPKEKDEYEKYLEENPPEVKPKYY